MDTAARISWRTLGFDRRIHSAINPHLDKEFSMRAFRATPGGWTVGVAILAASLSGCSESERAARPAMAPPRPSAEVAPITAASPAAAPAAPMILGEPSGEERETVDRASSGPNTEAYDRIVDNAFVRVAQ
jgi:hypothetical protein